jgi:hypothetical protein
VTAKVLGLHLGLSVRAVMQRLGIPEVIYEVFEAKPPPVTTLRYGAWELSFRNGALYSRVQ